MNETVYGGEITWFSVRWSEEDTEWVGTCNKFPSLSWLAPTREQALDGIKKLVEHRGTVT